MIKIIIIIMIIIFAIIVISICRISTDADLRMNEIMDSSLRQVEHEQYCKGRNDAIENIALGFVNQEKFYFGCYAGEENTCREIHCYSCLENFLKESCGMEGK